MTPSVGCHRLSLQAQNRQGPARSLSFLWQLVMIAQNPIFIDLHCTVVFLWSQADRDVANTIILLPAGCFKRQLSILACIDHVCLLQVQHMRHHQPHSPYNRPKKNVGADLQAAKTSQSHNCPRMSGTPAFPAATSSHWYPPLSSGPLQTLARLQQAKLYRSPSWSAPVQCPAAAFGSRHQSTCRARNGHPCWQAHLSAKPLAHGSRPGRCWRPAASASHATWRPRPSLHSPEHQQCPGTACSTSAWSLPAGNALDRSKEEGQAAWQQEQAQAFPQAPCPW